MPARKRDASSPKRNSAPFGRRSWHTTIAKEAYLAECQRKNRESTYKGYKWRLDKRFPWGRRNIADITPRDVLAKLNSLNGTPMEKRYTFVAARSFFNWCVAQHILDVSPVTRLDVPPPGRSRERVLTPAELRAIWDACPDDPYGTTVKLLILTGQRRGEIRHITLDGDLATIPSAHTKNKRTHVFPVGEMARELLGKPRVFNGWGKSKARLDKDAGVTGWTLHDLRRTYATTLAESGTPPHVIEAILNHKSGIISGVASVYNRCRYTDEMWVAVAAFEKSFAALLQADPSKDESAPS